MSTTRQTLQQWFEHPLRSNATHLLVVTDTYDWEDYPVYAAGDEDCRAQLDAYHNKNMQRVTEVYDLRAPMLPQLDTHRSWSVPQPTS